MNKYLSKYSKHDTHFKRTDEWPGAAFDDDGHLEVSTIIISVLAFAGFIATLLLIIFF